MQHLYCLLLKRQSDQLIVSLLQELECIFISELYGAQLSQNLCVDDPQVVINGLVKHYVVYLIVDHLANCSQPLDAINIYLLKQVSYYF